MLDRIMLDTAAVQRELTDIVTDVSFIDTQIISTFDFIKKTLAENCAETTQNSLIR